MNTPLRWVYPKSYQTLEALAKEAGIHPYEYQALIDIGTSASHVVTVQRNVDEWSQAFTSEEFTKVSESVSAFFSKAVHEMGEAIETEYLNFMHQREV